jgi:hypothetical protein
MSVATTTPDSVVLTCWKDIARYFGKGVRTVQRWEHCLGMPVRRPAGSDHKAPIVAYAQDLEAWVQSRWSPRILEEGSELDQPAVDSRVLHAELFHGLRVARALRQEMRVLRKDNRDLMQQLASSLDALSRSSRQSPWQAACTSCGSGKPPVKPA